MQPLSVCERAVFAYMLLRNDTYCTSFGSVMRSVHWLSHFSVFPKVGSAVSVSLSSNMLLYFAVDREAHSARYLFFFFFFTTGDVLTQH